MLFYQLYQLFWFCRNEVDKKNQQQEMASAMKTPGLDFVMDISEVKTSFKVFYWLSDIDKSNIGTCLFQFTLWCKIKSFFSCLMKANTFFIKMLKLKIFFIGLQSLFKTKYWKDGNVLS